jgi:hygromycin-B 4-O-kinase
MSFEKMNLTVEQVREFQAQQSPEPVSDVVALPGGEWSQAFAFKQGEEDYVIRFNPDRDDFLKDAYADQFSSPALPIPKIIRLGEAFDGHYAISERAFGTMLDDLGQPAMKRLVPSLLRALDDIREADVSTSNGFGAWDCNYDGIHASWRDALLSVETDDQGSRLHGWRRALEQSPVSDAPFRDAYKKLIDLTKDMPQTRSLIHNDLLHFNVLTRDDQITAVFDWGFAMYGDPLYDIAMFAFWGGVLEPLKNTDWKTEAKLHSQEMGLEVPEFERRFQCCMLHLGLDLQTYYAFKRNWEWLKPVTTRTLEIAEHIVNA